MNLKLSTLPSPETIIPNLHILLEHNSQGNAMIATVLELPNCHAEAPTREQALEELKKQVVARLEKAELLSLELQPPPVQQPENPWMKFAGAFKDDSHFDEFQQAIQDYRREADAQTYALYPELNPEREDY
jgi:predicted RNase H-like HicB family nuclease